MQNKIEEYVKKVNGALFDYFDSCPPEYSVLFDSMKYSLKNGGKRVRPLLTLLFCEAAGGDVKAALPFGVAVEFIHTYSLIHDDLPCMDNDDFRRGKPSNHKAFGEANALLAGDALLTAAFEIITDGAKHGLYSFEAACEAVNCLSSLAGARGMVGGQIIDLDCENKNVGIETLKLMDSLKTGALIKAACTLGCIAANADCEKKRAAAAFAENIGLAFQIQDDILDVTSTLSKLGKKTGSDKVNNKSTYVGIIGLDECRLLVDELTKNALSALSVFDNSDSLVFYAEYLSKREN